MILVRKNVLACLVCSSLFMSSLAVISSLQVRPAFAVADDPVFTVYGDQPVLNHGKDGSWNGIYTDPGAVLYHDGQFHMFYNGFNGWPASVQIGYATSPDGLKWTMQGTDPIVKSAEVSYAGVAALASSVLVEDDGTWVLYLYTWETNSNTSTGKIGRATAKQPRGPWTIDEKPILAPGSAGAWDEHRVDAPSVIKTDKGYLMFYGGSDNENHQSIGMATSKNGLIWQKYDNAKTVDARFAESDPVMQAGTSKEWDAPRVHQPRVVQTPEGLVMVYRSVRFGTPSTIALGYAKSKDGITWERSAHNPILQAKEAFAKKGFWYTALAYDGKAFYLYVEAQPGKIAETAVFAAVHEGALE